MESKIVGKSTSFGIAKNKACKRKRKQVHQGGVEGMGESPHEGKKNERLMVDGESILDVALISVNYKG